MRIIRRKKTMGMIMREWRRKRIKEKDEYAKYKDGIAPFLFFFEINAEPIFQ